MDDNKKFDTVALTQVPDTQKKPLQERILNSGVFAPFYLVLYILFAISLVVYILSRFITPFAEFIAVHPSQAIRLAMAKITSFIPFSLAETLLLLIPIFIALYMVYTWKKLKSDDQHATVKVIMPLVSVILIMCILFFSMFAPCYFRNSLSKNLGLSDDVVTSDELYNTSVWLCENIKKVLPDVIFSVNGESHMPYGYDELTVLVNSAFHDYASEVDYISSFTSRPKPIMLSEPMLYTHISGVYTFFTGEANINTNYPDFLIPYTMAHELSHQRGIAREDEANMVAFLVCLKSRNAYVKYSGLTNMLSYLTSALYKADKDQYNELMAKYYPDQIKKEMKAYSIFFEKYRESVANKVTDAVNNTFLQSQGQSQGTKSYGLVVDLTVAYYKSISN